MHLLSAHIIIIKLAWVLTNEILCICHRMRVIMMTLHISISNLLIQITRSLVAVLGVLELS